LILVHSSLKANSTPLIKTRGILAGLCLFCALSLVAEGQSGVTLPTPRDHFKTYNVESARLDLMRRVLGDLKPQMVKIFELIQRRSKTESSRIQPEEVLQLARENGLELIARVLSDRDPETRKKLSEFLQTGAQGAYFPQMESEPVIQLGLATALWKYKPEMLEILLHGSRVLEAVPEEFFKTYGPFIHDALLGFLDGLSEERLVDRAVDIAKAKNASRGEKILIFASKIPTLQKIGQILARVEGIPPDIQQSLQSLENGIRTMTREELVTYIEKDAGAESIKKYDMQFADKSLAEASVGAVISGSFQPLGESRRRSFVCKAVKPYVQSGLPEEMRSIDRLIALVKEFAGYYRIEGLNLKDFFADIRGHLEREIKVSEEQAHLRMAYEFYKHHQGVKVPEIFQFSTEHTTFMEYLDVEKLTDSFPGDRKRRRILAERLATIMTFDALFSKQRTAVFHGDPHAGNIMRITDDPKDPYKLGLLDWGLVGEFPREQRMQMVQLSLAYGQKSKERMVRNVSSLVKGGLPKDPQKRARLEEMVGRAMVVKAGTFQVYGALLEELLKAGYVLDPEFSLFIKAQLTIAGILRELDPTLDQDKLVRKKTIGLVMKEIPKRLALLPAWKYRGYRSMLSNGDLFREIF